MKKINALLIASAALAAIVSCSVPEYNASSEAEETESPVCDIPGGALPGRIIVKLAEPIADTRSDDLFAMLGEYSISRTFPSAGEFEPRHQRYGLDRWYTVDFNPELPLTRAASGFYGIEGVECLEFDYILKPSDMPFNDPKISEQWHYSNDGSRSFSVQGCDVNAFKAWEITTGSPDVIVAVCDSGVDYEHEDLADNMWANEAEKNGLPGKDDDGNGYIDDVYGYNFCVGPSNQMVGKIEPEDHGTHVAGTIAAVNNNGKGVAGIAGGSGSGINAVRIMSVQTISEYGANIGAAIVYAADHGAVLMNCSWGLPDAVGTPQYVSEAIEYFNNEAGMGADGVQVGPMAGGVIFFAAGNDGFAEEYPAMDENIYAVSALGADYIKTTYTNYGDWVDFCAPGGEQSKQNPIMSTAVGNQYKGFQGTSMACPHVTGVAALAVSRFKGPGFTREKLIRILQQSSVKTVYEYNSAYKGMLGAGLVDAYAAVMYEDAILQKVKDLNVEVQSNNIRLAWTIPGTSGQGAPELFLIYSSGSSLLNLDPANPGTGVKIDTVNCAYNRAGDQLKYEMAGLDFEKTYYIRIAEQNFDGSFSELSDEVSITTPVNNPPVIEPLSDVNISLKASDKVIVKFKVYDPDGHTLSYLISGLPEQALTHSIVGSELYLAFDAKMVKEAGLYEGEILLSDGYASVIQEISFEITNNTPPYAAGTIPDAVLNGLGTKLEAPINLSQYFKDDDGDNLSYTYKTDVAEQVVKVEISGNQLNLVAVKPGTANMTISASDSYGETVTQSFAVFVRDNTYPVDVYPNPVVDVLTINVLDADKLNVKLLRQTGALVCEEEFQNLTPFNPAKIDLGAIPPGTYNLILNYDGQTYRQNIVKL